MKRFGLAALLVLALSGCVTVWTKVDQPVQTAADGTYSVDAPTGWVRYTFDSQRITVTRDGLDIQRMTVEKLPHDKVFAKTKKITTERTLPSELAELLLAELKVNNELPNIEVKENQPYQVAGRPGFMLHVQFRNTRGALFDRVIYGTAQKDGVLLFSYNALHVHYYDRDRAVFEKFVASYKQIKAA